MPAQPEQRAHARVVEGLASTLAVVRGFDKLSLSGVGLSCQPLQRPLAADQRQQLAHVWAMIHAGERAA